MSAIDISYFEAGYIDETYFTRVTDTEVPISIQVTATCEVSVIRGAVVVMAVAFTQTVQGTDNNFAELFAFTNAQLTAAAQRIRTTNIAVTGVFTVAANATKSVYVLSQEDSAFALSVAASRLRVAQAATSAAFSLTGPSAGNTALGTVSRTSARVRVTIVGDLDA
jgi:hypothetical protein